LKKIILILICLVSTSAWSQTFDACASDLFYPASGPTIVHAEQIGGNVVALNSFPALLVNGTGSINGLGANRLDGCLYYINNSGGSTYLIKMDANGDTTIVNSNMTYTVNGTVDACGRYLQYELGMVLRFDIASGFRDTLLIPALDFITDLDYNPFNCKYYFVEYYTGDVFEVDQNGILTDTILTPEVGTTFVGGMALSDDGTEVYISNLGQLWSYSISSGSLNSIKTITTPAAGAPIADLASFQCDDVIADITNGTDTLTIISCLDSIDVTFSNYSTGTNNLINWDFGNGDTDNIYNPTSKFETNATYEITVMATRFTCETCQLDSNNFDTLTLVIEADTLYSTTLGIDPVCAGDLNGSGNVTNVTGGTSPYTYLWQASGTTTSNESNLGAGTAFVTITDVNNCSVTDSVVLVEPPAVELTPSPDTTICINGTLILDATVSGGSGSGYSYSWTGLGAGPQTLNPTVDGCYEVIATDGNGCVSLPMYQCVTIEAPLNLTVIGSDICAQTPADLSSIAGGGNGMYNYDWTVGGVTVGNLATLQTPQSVSTTYCLTLTDGCETPSVTECITINVLPEPVLIPAFYEECEGAVINFANPVLDPSGISSCTWDFGDGTMGTGLTPSHVYNHAGLYSVTLNLVTIENCIFQMVLADIVTIQAVPQALFSYHPQVITIENTEVDFINTSIDADSYYWEFGNSGPNSTLTDPSYQFPEISNGSYPVTLWAYNGICEDSITLVITINDILVYYIPNAFTPDGDSNNDEFKPIITSGYDYFDYHLTIFNRWGELIFESFIVDYGWNGTFGNGKLAQNGVYVWKLELGELFSDKKLVDTGHITLIK